MTGDAVRIPGSVGAASGRSGGCGVVRALIRAVACLIAGGGASAAELHVVPDGNVTGVPEVRLFRTIREAVARAQSGDAVVVHDGVYRERVVLTTGMTLRAADGARVVISGFHPIRGWQPLGGGVWNTVVSGSVNDLFVGSIPQRLATWPGPDAPWLQVDAVDAAAKTVRDDALKGVEALAEFAKAPDGTFVYAHLRRGNYYGRFRVQRVDLSAGKLSLHAKGPLSLQTGDRYVLCGHRSFISGPGQWAYESLPGGRTRLFFRPQRPSDLEKTQYRNVGRPLLFIGHWKEQQSNIRVEGLEIAGGADQGVMVRNARQVVIERCIIHHNGKNGVFIRPGKEVTVRRCVVFANGAGIAVASSENVVIEQDEVAANWVDGIVVAGDVSGRGLIHTTKDVVVRRNYVHHHLFLRHPDNFQTYRGVSGLLLEENLALWAGQGLMTEETRDSALLGNVILGTGAIAVIFGHGNSNGWRVERNTVGLGGWGAFSLTGKDYVLMRNIVYGNWLASGGDTRGDFNLVWPGAEDAPFAITARPWRVYATAAAFAERTGHDQHSLKADPRLRAAPFAQVVVNDLKRSTADRLFVRGRDRDRPTAGFEVGDYIEVNGDGVVRRVVGVDEASISIQPPLPGRPFRITLVWNWKDRRDFRLDVRPAEGSPAITKFDAAASPGSRLDAAAFMRGDFDGDGVRDLPRLAPDLPASIPDPNAPPIPFTVR